MTRDEVLAEVRRLKGEGYDVIPYDDPLEPSRGFYCTRPIDDIGSHHEVLLKWHLFGEVLEPQFKDDVLPQEFLDLHGQNNVALADDPKALLLGLVQYFPNEKRCEVSRVRLHDFKGWPKDIRDQVSIVRAPYLAEHEVRRKEVADVL